MKTHNTENTLLSKVKIVDPNSGVIIGEKIIDLNQTKLPHKVIHNKLSIDLENRLQKIWRVIGPFVGFKNYKHFHKNMRMELHIEREINAWESIVDIFSNWVQKENTLSKTEKIEGFNLILSWSVSGLDFDEFLAINSDALINKAESVLNHPFSKN